MRRAYPSETPEGAADSCYVHFLFDVVHKDDGAGLEQALGALVGDMAALCVQAMDCRCAMPLYEAIGSRIQET